MPTGTGSSCSRHYPPVHLAEHNDELVRQQAEDIYATARAALREMRAEPNPYLALYMAHLSIEKMLKCIIWTRGKTFEHGHNLVVLLKRALTDEPIEPGKLDYLSELNNFQTAGKYPIEMKNIVEHTDKVFIQHAMNNMEEVLEWLSSIMK